MTVDLSFCSVAFMTPLVFLFFFADPVDSSFLTSSQKNLLNGTPPRNGSQRRAKHIFSWFKKTHLRKLTCPRTLWLQRSRECDRKDGGRALRRRSSGRRSVASGWPPSRRRAAREARESWLQRRCGMVWRRRTVVLATGAPSCARGVCSRSTPAASCQAGTQKQVSRTGQWLTSQALPFIIGGDFQVEPKQMGDSGWVRAVGGFVVAPQLPRPRRRVKLPRISPSTSHLTGPSESFFPRG